MKWKTIPRGKKIHSIKPAIFQVTGESRKYSNDLKKRLGISNSLWRWLERLKQKTTINKKKLAVQIGFDKKAVNDDASLMKGAKIRLSLVVSAGMEGVQPVMVSGNGDFEWKWNNDGMKVREVLSLLHEDGCYLVNQEGSHRQFKHPKKPGRVTVAGKPGETLHPKTLASILRQAKLTLRWDD